MSEQKDYYELVNDLQAEIIGFQRRIKELEEKLRLKKAVAGNKMNPEANKAVIIGIVNDLLQEVEG